MTYGNLWQGRVLAFIVVVFYLLGLAFSVPRRRVDTISTKMPSFSTN
jgi:hypothetical protein